MVIAAAVAAEATAVAAEAAAAAAGAMVATAAAEASACSNSHETSYCYTCGHHPVGANHTSVTCTKKCEGHNNLVTTDHRFGGCNFWPGLNKVKSSQQDHPKYKGKSANN